MEDAWGQVGRYVDRGWFVYPSCWPDAQGGCGCGRGHEKAGKAPLTSRGYKEASRDPEVLEAWRATWPEANLALRLDTSGIFVVDLDGPEAVAEARELGLGSGPYVKSGSGEHWYFSVPHGMAATRSTKRGRSGGIDLLADGGIVAPPSRHWSGARYAWQEAPGPGDLPPVPQWALDMLSERREAPLAVVLEPRSVVLEAPALSPEGMRVWQGDAYQGDRSRALASLSMHLVRGGMTDQQMLVDTLHAWDVKNGEDNGKGPKYAGRRDAALQYSRLAESAVAREPKPGASKQVALVEAYCAQWPGTMFIGEQWHAYEDGVWSEVPKYLVEGRIQGLMGAGAQATTVLAVERLLRARLVQGPEVWSAAPGVIVGQNGAVDVETGELRAHSPLFYARRKAEWHYSPESMAPGWSAFIEGRFEPEVGAWLQEFVGIALTCDMGHEAAVWLYSPPGAGKSTFIAGVRAALGPGRCGKLSLGDIARNPRFAMVNVPGKTLLEASEQPNAYLESSDLLNSLISGDTITIEAKHQNPFEWTPTAKLLWGMNELPSVASANDGIFRRVKIVKMQAIEVRDPGVRAKIEREGAGILRWAMAGLRRLRDSGQTLEEREPRVMREWRRAYQSANDVAATFCEERVEAQAGARVQSQSLYDAYYTYCLRNGFKPKSRNKISADWSRLGFEAVSLGGRRFYRDIVLRGADDD